MVTTGVPPWIGKPQMPQILRDVVWVKVVQIHQRLSKSGETVFLAEDRAPNLTEFPKRCAVGGKRNCAKRYFFWWIIKKWRMRPNFRAMNS